MVSVLLNIEWIQCFRANTFLYSYIKLTNLWKQSIRRETITTKKQIWKEREHGTNKKYILDYDKYSSESIFWLNKCILFDFYSMTLFFYFHSPFSFLLNIQVAMSHSASHFTILLFVHSPYLLNCYVVLFAVKSYFSLCSSSLFRLPIRLCNLSNGGRIRRIQNNQIHKYTLARTHQNQQCEQMKYGGEWSAFGIPFVNVNTFPFSFIFFCLICSIGWHW